MWVETENWGNSWAPGSCRTISVLKKTRGRRDKKEEKRNKGGKGCIKSRYCLLVPLLGSLPQRMVWWDRDERKTLKKEWSIPFCCKGGGGEGSEWRLLTQQEMSRHIHTVVFPLRTWLFSNTFLKVTLHPIWFCRKRYFQKLTTFLLLSLLPICTSVWSQVRLQLIAGSLKKPFFWPSSFSSWGWHRWFSSGFWRWAGQVPWFLG